MRPGTHPFCSTCRHLDRPMSESGHPRPCLRVTWQGPQLHLPAIDDGSCAEFEAIDEETPRVGPSRGVHPDPSSQPPHATARQSFRPAPAAPAPESQQ